MSSLNPVMRVGDQVEESVGAHERLSPRERRTRAAELLDRVGIPAVERRMRSYPHEFSGGMRQRVLIAAAIASKPRDPPRRRADHGPRRDHPGPDPEPAARAAARLRDEHGAREPRPGRDRGDVRSHRRHVRRRDRRARRYGDAPDCAAPPVHDLVAALPSRPRSEDPVSAVDRRVAAAADRHRARAVGLRRAARSQPSSAERGRPSCSPQVAASNSSAAGATTTQGGPSYGRSRAPCRCDRYRTVGEHGSPSRLDARLALSTSSPSATSTASGRRRRRGHLASRSRRPTTAWMLERDDIDVIDVVTGDSGHFDLTMAGARSR